MTETRGRVVVDVGAGDGRASLRVALGDPGTLAIAVDPSIDELRHGARTALRRKLGNALFVVAPVEALPAELDDRADEVTINFPWGSLLRGLVRAEPLVLGPLARLAKRGARVRVLLSVETRDRATGMPALDLATLAAGSAAYASAGLVLERCDVATRGEIATSGSSWGKRLGHGRRVFVLDLRRP